MPSHRSGPSGAVAIVFFSTSEFLEVEGDSGHHCDLEVQSQSDTKYNRYLVHTVILYKEKSKLVPMSAVGNKEVELTVTQVCIAKGGQPQDWI